MTFSIIDSGRPERVYIERYPDGDGRQLVSENGAEPVWSPTGSELFYRSGDGRGLWTIEFDSSTGRLGDSELLFEGPYKLEGLTRWAEYDVSADGQEFLMIRLEEATVGEKLRVVTKALAGLDGE